MNHTEKTERILIQPAELCKFYHISETELMGKTLDCITQMQDGMITVKNTELVQSKAKEGEFLHVIKTYLSIYPTLTKYWSEDEIAETCAKYATISSITDERNIPVKNIILKPEDYHPDNPSEYLRTKSAHVNRYTKSGEQLMYGEYKMCHIYRVKNRYQGLVHGDIILALLYKTYPELEEFQFKAYEMHGYRDYEIYPNNNIYTPFEALMTKDIDTIIERNKKYCQSYNCGICTPEALEKRLESDEIKHYFNVIRNMTPKA